MKSGTCPKCGGVGCVIMPKRRHRVVRHQGWKSDEYQCQNCGYTEAYRRMG